MSLCRQLSIFLGVSVFVCVSDGDDAHIPFVCVRVYVMRMLLKAGMLSVDAKHLHVRSFVCLFI